MGTAKGLLITLAIGLLAVAAFVWSGIYNIAASEPHAQLTLWLVAKTRDRSIAAHSQGMHVTRSDSPELLDVGFEHYHGMCRLCHGAPGHPRTEFAQGLYPSPPDLASQPVQARTDPELYWILQNGIKMTGMPAFGMTHSDGELLALLAFLRRVPGMPAREYDAMLQRIEAVGGEGDHHHAHSGTDPVEPSAHGHDGHTHEGHPHGDAGQ